MSRVSRAGRNPLSHGLREGVPKVSIIAFIVVLCALVVIHEFGHFIVAKLLGIGVEVFSVGFGKRLWGFRIGETDYRLSLVPLGGYVRFRGENLEMLQGKS